MPLNSMFLVTLIIFTTILPILSQNITSAANTTKASNTTSPASGNGTYTASFKLTKLTWDSNYLNDSYPLTKKIKDQIKSLVKNPNKLLNFFFNFNFFRLKLN